MINTGDTDPTFIETNIPWVARVIGDDRQQAYLLVDYWYRKLGLERVGDHPRQQPLRALRRAGDQGREPAPGPPRSHRDGLQGGPGGLLAGARAGESGRPDAVVHWGDADEGALILNQMREMGMDQPFFGCDRTVSDEFVSSRVTTPRASSAGFPWNPTRKSARLERFRKAFRERFGVEPDTYAAHAYDGMNMMLWAIQVAGLNRAKIRDVVAHMPHPWPGVTGDIVLSAALDDVGETYPGASSRTGAGRYRSREELEIPRGDIPPRDRINRARRPPVEASAAHR